MLWLEVFRASGLLSLTRFSHATCHTQIAAQIQSDFSTDKASHSRMVSRR